MLQLLHDGRFRQEVRQCHRILLERCQIFRMFRMEILQIFSRIFSFILIT
jgi:hypothetical protein